MRQAMILASASMLGIAATAAELQRGRLMRAPDHLQEFPKWAYGPDGSSGIFNSADEIPSGWEDHPSKVGISTPEGVHTPIVSANGERVSEKRASKSRAETSATITDPAVAAKSGVGGLVTPATGDTASQPTAASSTSGNTAEVDAHGHPFDANLHAATRSKTKDGLWRMKVGVKRPDPAPGFPLDL